MAAMRTDEVISSAALSVLTEIFTDKVQLVQWQRPVPPSVAGYLHGLAESGDLPLGRRGVLRSDELAALDGWPQGDGRVAMEADINWLAGVLCTLLDCDGVSWRVEVLRKAMCPRFHVDRTGIRLVTTWLGPGTEWLGGDDLPRHKLGAGSGGLPDEQSGLMDGARTGRSQAGDVLLLKGSLWQGNAGRGAIHRSPATSSDDTPRVMLAMDGWWQ